LNEDGVVDGGDLGLLLLEWGTPGCIGEGLPCAADLDCNGTVDGSDLGLLLLAFGACPAGCEALAPSQQCCELVPAHPGCEEEGMMGGAGEAQPENSSPVSSEDESFIQWALGATLEELFDWLESVFLEGSE
jgi:hypothetical protein